VNWIGLFGKPGTMAHVTTWQADRIYVRYSGYSSDREVAAAVREFQADERYDTVRHIIHDFTDCLGLVFSEDLVLELAATDAAAALSKPPHTVAVVTTRSDVLRMTEAYLSSGLIPRSKLRIFPDLGAALAFAEK
jgi:hypothetical protein